MCTFNSAKPTVLGPLAPAGVPTAVRRPGAAFDAALAHGHLPHRHAAAATRHALALLRTELGNKSSSDGLGQALQRNAMYQ